MSSPLPQGTLSLPSIYPSLAESWYTPSLPGVPPRLRTILEQYSHIPPQDIEQHLLTIQRKAWAIRKYPCIGRWHFLRLNLPEYPQWNDILKLVKDRGIYLDVGAFLAAELRTLSSEPGVDVKNLYALDLFPDFLELGLECFNDGSRLPKDHFIAADFFSSDDERINALMGKVSVLHAGAFLHLFSYEKSAAAVKRMIELSRPRAGSMILGRLLGAKNAAHVTYGGNADSLRYRHNEESFRKMFEEIGRETGTNWDVWTEQKDIGVKEGQKERDAWMPEDGIVLRFCARRL